MRLFLERFKDIWVLFSLIDSAICRIKKSDVDSF